MVQTKKDDSDLTLFFDTMYSNTNNAVNKKIYSQFISSIEESDVPVLASLVEQCQGLEVKEKQKVQELWNLKLAESIEPVAADNPYLPDIVGEEVAALAAVAWTKGSRGVDCRPKVYDSVSKSWKLCDTGSMVTAVKKGPHDKLDETRYLQAVNGSKIQCYGKKEIEVRLGRKTYTIEAIVADVSQDILGWDFLQKYKLNWEWSQFGDLYLVDKKAKSRNLVKFHALPAYEQMSLVGEVDSVHAADIVVDNSVTEFEIASMKLLGAEEEKELNKYLENS